MFEARVRSVTEVHISGVIDETINLKEKLSVLSGEVHINCREVSRINSYGMKGWLLYWSEIRGKGAKLKFYEISPFVVQALKVVKDFIPTKEIVSVCAPFFCEPCGTDIIKVYTIEELSAFPPLPEAQCPTCKATLELDEHKSFFSFAQKK
jgi:anti-anti-sigma regulatory factor